MNPFQRLLKQIALSIAPDLRDGAHWSRLNTPTPFDSSLPLSDSYAAALEAWRLNPYAKRIIDLITDYTIGDGLSPAARGEIGRFLDRFWNHPENHLNLRLPDLMDELSRSGDLFLVLFLNPTDGISYIRPIPKSDILDIQTSALDWEKEIVIFQKPLTGSDIPIKWLTPAHPDADSADAVILHYSINKPIGALLGQSELATIIPWLQRYSRMLEDRVRLNWAARAFLWFVKVPTNQVPSKAEQYAIPPEPGSIIVHDDGESWDLKTPALQGNDARHDLQAIRQLIAAGSGQPLHWLGDGGDVNLATAKAMNDPAIRHLRRRQRHLHYLLLDLCTVAYSRAYAAGRVRTAISSSSPISIDMPDISRDDNSDLASAAANLANALSTLSSTTALSQSPTLRRRILQLVFKFAGESISPDELVKIDSEQAAASPSLEPSPVAS